MNQPTWPPAPHQPPPRRRGPVITLLAVAGLLVGMAAPTFTYAVLTGQPSPFGALATLAGAGIGLVAGIWAGVRMTRR